MSDDVHSGRLDRVESEVSTIRGEIGGIIKDVSAVRADVRGLGSVLQRIEQGVSNAQQRFDDDKQASRINPIAMGSVLLTIISILVGGSWLISGELSRHDERSIHQQRQVDRIEQRMWVSGVRGGQHAAGPSG